MFNKIVRNLIGMSSLALSTFAMAKDQTKDEWLTSLRDAAAPMVCKNLTGNAAVNKLLVQANITYEKCIALIPATFDKCKTQYYFRVPDTINTEAAAKWGNAIGECVGTDFAVTYLTATVTPPVPDAAVSSPKSAEEMANEISKTVWLSRIRAAAPELICTGLLKDQARSVTLARLNISYEKCLTLIPDLFSKCEKELDKSLPSSFNKQSGEMWEQVIGECIGSAFEKKYLLSASPQS